MSDVTFGHLTGLDKQGHVLNEFRKLSNDVDCAPKARPSPPQFSPTEGIVFSLNVSRVSGIQSC